MGNLFAGGLPRPLPLPDFPWDTLRSARELAASHPGGIVDLSVGTPVDETPLIARQAISAAADAPGYPQVEGTKAGKDAVHQWMSRRGLVPVPDNGILPTIGSKEAIAWLPTLLGMGPGDRVLFPDCAYPTYDVSARLCGAEPVPVDQENVDSWPYFGVAEAGAETAKGAVSMGNGAATGAARGGAILVWLNSPSNPTGHVLSVDQLRAVVEWARARGAIVVSDECYAELPWSDRYVQAGVPSILDPQVCQGDPQGLLLVYSLSKQSNLAGYRDGILVGDPVLVDAVLEGRKHAGFMVPTPVQAVLAATLPDMEHVAEQRLRYQRRRQILVEAVQQAGLIVDPNTEAGLYLWLRAGDELREKLAVAPVYPAPGQPAASGNAASPRAGETIDNEGRRLVRWLAERGILVAPGDFYGTGCTEYVRMGLTATDERVQEVARRLAE